ncbi:MAG: hypothetical protein ACRDH2_13560, partial [Anaerolineales bacterium]
MNSIFEEHFGLRLVREGFTRTDDRKWIRRRTNEIADLFQIQAMKGASYSPVWGFSLNYVPHISGESLRSHGTDKSARLDYRYDPLDTDYGSKAKYEAWFISQLHGVEYATQSAKRSAGKSIPLAFTLFSQVNSVSDLSQLYAKSLQAYRSRT